MLNGPLKIFLIVLTFVATAIFSRASYAESPTNFVGTWSAYGYTCEPPGDIAVVPREVVEISYHDNQLKATKIQGDDCVTSGAVTWQVQIADGIEFGRNYYDHVQGGWPSRPNLQWDQATVQFVSPSEIIVLPRGVDVSGSHITFVKQAQ